MHSAVHARHVVVPDFSWPLAGRFFGVILELAINAANCADRSSKCDMIVLFSC